MQKKEEAYGQGERIIDYMKNSNKEENKIMQGVPLQIKMEKENNLRIFSSTKAFENIM